MALGDITGLRIHSYGDRAEVDVDGFSVGGTFKSGLWDSWGGTGNVPAVAQEGLPFYTPYAIVQTPGYNEAGGAVNRDRKIFFTTRQRKPHPDEAQWEEEVAGSTLTFRTFLSEFIYEDDLVKELHLSSEWYKSGATNNTELNLTGLTGTGNYLSNSALAYPTPIANWTRPDRTRLSSYSVTVAAIAFHPMGGMNGKPVAAIKFTATNGSQTASVTVSTFTKTTPPAGTPAASAKCIGEYIGTIDLTGFTDNTMVTVSMEVFPWKGSVKYDNSGGAGVNQWSPPQSYLLDVAGAYGHPIAVVDSTIGTASGVVGASDTSGNRTTCEATPFDTVANAQLALQTYITANHGGRTNIAGSTIYIKSNSSLAVGGASGIPVNAGNCAVLVKPFPGSVPVIPTGTSPQIRGRYVRFEGLSFSRSADGAFIDAAGTIEITCHRCEFADTRGTSQTDDFLDDYFKTWMSECKLTKLSSPGNFVLWRQCDLVDCGQMGRWHFVAGCRYTRLTAAVDHVFVDMGGGMLSSGSIAFNNEINDVGLGCFSYPGNDGSDISPVLVYHGCAIVQNLIIHKTGSASGARLIRCAADTSYNETHDCVIAHNDGIGNNSNVFYQDTPQTRKPHYGHALHYNLMQSCAAKTDTFADDARCTGNWPVHFGVNRIGQRVCGGNFPVAFNGIHSQAGNGEAGAGDFLQPHFINDTSAIGTPGTGSDGDFHPSIAGSNFKHIVMELCHVGWDIEGENRFYDSIRGYYFDAAGCYRYRRSAAVPGALTGLRLTPASWLLSEDFEGTGTPSGWTAPTAGGNFDETTNAITGQSLSVTGPSTSTFRFAKTPILTGLNPAGSTWMVYWKMKMTAAPSGGNARVLEVQRASDSLISQVGQIIQTTNVFRLANGSGVSGTGEYAMSIGTVYHVWIKRMADGTLQGWVNTSATFPGGAAMLNGSASQNPGDAGYLCIGSGRLATVIYDHLRISNTDIGSNPA